MSAITFGIVALVSYLLGAGLGFAAKAEDDEDLTGLFRITVAVAIICLLVLIGVRIGGAK